MTGNGLGLSRRRFLGGSMVAAVAGLSSDLFNMSLGAQTRSVSALPLDELRPMGALDEAYWWKVRSQFNIVDGLAFMNNGTQGPMPRVVREKNERLSLIHI